jgi:hypothetical protein
MAGLMGMELATNFSTTASVCSERTREKDGRRGLKDRKEKKATRNAELPAHLPETLTCLSCRKKQLHWNASPVAQGTPGSQPLPLPPFILPRQLRTGSKGTIRGMFLDVTGAVGTLREM